MKNVKIVQGTCSERHGVTIAVPVLKGLIVLFIDNQVTKLFRNSKGSHHILLVQMNNNSAPDWFLQTSIFRNVFTHYVAFLQFRRMLLQPWSSFYHSKAATMTLLFFMITAPLWLCSHTSVENLSGVSSHSHMESYGNQRSLLNTINDPGGWVGLGINWNRCQKPVDDSTQQLPPKHDDLVTTFKQVTSP